MKKNRPKILLLCDYNVHGASTVLDHINALCNSEKLEVVKLSNLGNLPYFLNLNLFDAIVIHYSIVMCSDTYLSSKARGLIQNYSGLKACFIQDEYRFIDSTVSAMKEMGINLLFTVVPQGIGDKIYSPSTLIDLEKIYILTGYAPDELKSIQHVPSYDERPLDVVYRSRSLPYWLGKLGQEKLIIADRFNKDGARYNLKMDISAREIDRIYGNKWINFLISSKACLGTESGASVMDFTGSIQRNVDDYVINNPDATFEEVSNKFLSDIDGQIVINVISPRAFESAALKTLMILYPGEYSGILQPWKHYIPLAHDHSNMQEVVEALRDKQLYTQIVETTYNDLIMSNEYGYNKLTETFERAILNRLFIKQEYKAPSHPHIRGYYLSFLYSFERRIIFLLGYIEVFFKNFILSTTRVAIDLGKWFLFRVFLRNYSEKQKLEVLNKIKKWMRPLTSRIP